MVKVLLKYIRICTFMHLKSYYQKQTNMNKTHAIFQIPNSYKSGKNYEEIALVGLKNGKFVAKICTNMHIYGSEIIISDMNK